MAYAFRTTERHINGLLCRFSLSTGPSHGGSGRLHHVYGSIALAKAPNVFLTNEVFLDAMTIEEGEPEESILDRAERVCSLERLEVKARENIILLTGLFVDHFGLPDHPQEGKISV